MRTIIPMITSLRDHTGEAEHHKDLHTAVSDSGLFHLPTSCIARHSDLRLSHLLRSVISRSIFQPVS